VGLAAVSLTQLAPRAVTQTNTNSYYVVQHHSKSSHSIPIKRLYATSLVKNTNLILPCTIFKTLQSTGQIFPAAVNPDIQDCTICRQETRNNIPDCCVVQSMFRYLELFRWESQVWQTDRRTDGQALIYRYAVQPKTTNWYKSTSNKK